MDKWFEVKTKQVKKQKVLRKNGSSNDTKIVDRSVATLLKIQGGWFYRLGFDLTVSMSVKFLSFFYKWANKLKKVQTKKKLLLYRKCNSNLLFGCHFFPVNKLCRRRHASHRSQSGRKSVAGTERLNARKSSSAAVMTVETRKYRARPTAESRTSSEAQKSGAAKTETSERWHSERRKVVSSPEWRHEGGCDESVSRKELSVVMIGMRVRVMVVVVDVAVTVARSAAALNTSAA